VGHLAVELVLGLTRCLSAPPPLATGHQADEHGVDPDTVSAEVLGRVVHQAVEAAPPGNGRIDEPFKVSQALNCAQRRASIEQLIRDGHAAGLFTGHCGPLTA
jgi:hypothetical protein